MAPIATQLSAAMASGAATPKTRTATIETTTRQNFIATDYNTQSHAQNSTASLPPLFAPTGRRFTAPGEWSDTTLLDSPLMGRLYHLNGCEMA